MICKKIYVLHWGNFCTGKTAILIIYNIFFKFLELSEPSIISIAIGSSFKLAQLSQLSLIANLKES